MTKGEQVQRIKAKIREIESLSDRPFLVDGCLDELLSLVDELAQMTPEDQLTEGDPPVPEKSTYESAWQSLVNTKNKEGASFDASYKETRRYNASRKTQEKCDQAFSTLMKQIRLDTSMIRNA
ncbi:hypothetical protein BH09BAC4_BH09BAC4_23050 [soil metagenome]